MNSPFFVKDQLRVSSEGFCLWLRGCEVICWIMLLGRSKGNFPVSQQVLLFALLMMDSTFLFSSFCCRGPMSCVLKGVFSH